MKIKIREMKQENGLLGYMSQIAESKAKIREYFGIGQSTKAVLETQVNDYCRLYYGLTWKYDPALEMCVDSRYESFNKTLHVEDDTLIGTVHHIRGIVNEGMADVMTDAEKGEPTVIRPDKNFQCPAGWRYSGLSGGCVKVESEPTPISTFAQTETNVRTVYGTPAAPDDQFMQSGPSKYTQKSSDTGPAESKRSIIKLKI